MLAMAEAVLGRVSVGGKLWRSDALLVLHPCPLAWWSLVLSPSYPCGEAGGHGQGKT